MLFKSEDFIHGIREHSYTIPAFFIQPQKPDSMSIARFFLIVEQFWLEYLLIGKISKI